MKLVKPLFILVATTLFILACGLAGTGPTVPAEIQTETLPVMPVVPMRTLQPTQIPLPTFPQPAVQSTAFPDWVTDFSDPIMAVLDDQLPTMHDEFKHPNRGWFYFIPDSRINPFYAHFKDETLWLSLPAENERKDYWVYNPRITRKNFVLSFDVQFEESQPEDTFRFEFDQSADQSVALDLTKNQMWTLHWGPRNDWQSQTGTFEYLSPERIKVEIVVRGEQCAVYLNEDPLAYSSTCRTDDITRASPWAVTFHMLAVPGHTAAATIDNLKLWDLDKIPNLP